MKKLLINTVIYMAVFTSPVVYGQRFSTENEAAELALLVPPTNSDSTSKKSNSHKAATGSGRMFPMGQTATLTKGNGIKYNKMIIDPYPTYGIAPVGS